MGTQYELGAGEWDWERDWERESGTGSGTGSGDRVSVTAVLGGGPGGRAVVSVTSQYAEGTRPGRRQQDRDMPAGTRTWHCGQSSC